MKMSPLAVDTLIKPFEKCMLKAYKPTPKDVWTCGWGSTVGVLQTTIWTQAQADDALLHDLANAELFTNLYFDTADQDQFDALNDMMFNIGMGRPSTPGNPGKDGIVRLANGRFSTLFMYWRNGFPAQCADAMLAWDRQGDLVLAGLLIRRKADRLWFLGQHPAQAA